MYLQFPKGKNSNERVTTSYLNQTLTMTPGYTKL